MQQRLWTLTIFFIVLGNGPGKSRELYSAPKPNIIYILADDLGYGDLGCYGQKIIATPRLDAMAKSGLRFTRFYAGSTVCAPSRYALMTGMHMGHAYIRGNGEFPLRANEQTLPKLLKKAGYQTAMFGKWGLGQADNSGSPEKQGWDKFIGYNHHVHAHRFQTDHLWTIKDGQSIKYPMDTAVHTHTFLAEKVLEYVREPHEKPFFLYWAITMPHAEMRAPAEALTSFVKSDGTSIFKEENPFTNANFRVGNEYPSYRTQTQGNAHTAAMIHQLDADVGELLDLLAELGLDKNTYVMFTSDNGPHQEGGRTVEFFDSNGPLRGFKRDLYEGGIRVPFIINGPRLKQSKQIDEPWANYDILPTLMEIAGQPVPKDIDGISFNQLICGQKQRRSHPYLYWEFYERGFDQAIAYKNWKAVRQKNKGNQIELYNLTTDLSESQDVAAQNPALVKKMERLMIEAHKKSELFKVK